MASNSSMELTVHRAPIQLEVRGPVAESTGPRTRCGYLVPEAYGCYLAALGEQGAVASGKLLHFAADLVCSGGLDLWIRGVYDYAFTHIGLANPRIFVYLRDRVTELEKRAGVMPQEAFYAHPDVQSGIAEAVLVLQLCPRRMRLQWPRIGEDTKREGWIRGVAGSPETRATRAVWSSESDSTTLYLVGNELCKAIQDGATERSLFWAKWCLEEDGRLRKATKGSGLSSRDRGTGRSKRDIGLWIAALLEEVYKELAAKGLIRMNEEFHELTRLYSGSEARMPARLRRDCLGLMILICAEVPRWKVPAAASLVADPVRLSRAVGQGMSFFREVLAYPALGAAAQLKSSMTRAVRKPKEGSKADVKEKKGAALDEHFDEYDAALDAYLARSATGPVRKV